MEQQLINMERQIRQSHASHLFNRIVAEDSFASASVDTLASSWLAPRKTADGVGDFPAGTWPHGCVNGGDTAKTSIRENIPVIQLLRKTRRRWQIAMALRHPECGSASRYTFNSPGRGNKGSTSSQSEKSMCTAFQIIRCGTRTAHSQNP